MRKHLVHVMAIGAALAMIMTASAFAKWEVVRVGNIFLKGSGGIVPTMLPKHKQAPVSANVNGQIGTTDGSHPPALRSLIGDFDKTIHVNAKGLPACSYGQLTNRPTAAARRACPNAIVGSGEGAVEVAFPDQKPFTGTGRIILFNGGARDGTTLLLVHAYVSIPAPTSVVVPVRITGIHRGHYGIHALARIPVLAGGAGSPTMFKIKLERTFTYKGKKKSYLTASCPTGHYFTDAKVQFTGGTTLKITHVFPCTSKG